MSQESDFLAWVKQQQKTSDLVSLPAGDDLAILRWPVGDLLLVGIDQVLDSVHFDSTVHSPRDIGKKAMNRNLSDCAAMGCLPAAAVASVALHRGTGGDYLKELYQGMREAADRFHCEIVGGDTGSWDGKLALTVCILGKADGVTPITRTGARAGDGIYVTGPLGGSIRGRHLSFSPRVNEGRQLAGSGVVTAMIDLSDGLSRDLPRILSHGVIETVELPIHSDAQSLAGADGRSASEHALHDGEDYELLFTASSLPPIGKRIGEVTVDGGIQLRLNDGKMEPLEPKGWEHGL